MEDRDLKKRAQGVAKKARELDKAKAAERARRRQAFAQRQAAWRAKRAAPAQPGSARPAAPPSARAAAPTAGTRDEALQQRLDSLQRTFDGLQDDIMLTGVHSEMGTVEAELATLATDLQALRAQGYAFGNFLENKIGVLTDKWEALCDQIDDDIERQSSTLGEEADQAERLVQQAMVGNPAALSRAESAVQTLNSKCSSARATLSGRYNDVEQTIYQTRQQLNGVKWAFEQANQASFAFHPSEFLIAACKAKMLDNVEKDEGAEGILYLTDERILFEQKEKVATKKFLFVTTASEQVQELDFEAPVGAVERVEAQDARKMLVNRELLTLHLGPQVGLRQLCFRVLEGATNEQWSQLVTRAQSGDFERERVQQAAEEKAAVTEKLAAAPTVCPTCAATLPADIVRGQSTISCDYCGALIRL